MQLFKRLGKFAKKCKKILFRKNMNPLILMKLIFLVISILFTNLLAAQTYVALSSANAKLIEFNSENCVGFATPDYKCQPMKGKAFLFEPKGEYSALVMASHGAQGVDQRVFEYADIITKNGMAALVIDHWSPRNINIKATDYSVATARGGTTSSIATDAIWASEYIKSNYPQVKKMGLIGESMGAMAVIQLSRERMTDIFNKKMAPKTFEMPFAAMVGLYPACIDRVKGERFISTSFLIQIGELDDHTLAKDCVEFKDWVNANGGNMKIEVVPGVYHDFDAPHSLEFRRGQNVSKCKYLVDDTKITIVSSGKVLPNTLDGLVQIPRECSFIGLRSGYVGNKFVAVENWINFLLVNLK